jgi:hypothetical protein
MSSNKREFPFIPRDTDQEKKKRSIFKKASSDSGWKKMSSNGRSILSHPLCLPLLCRMYDKISVVADCDSKLPFPKLLDGTPSLVDNRKDLFIEVLKTVLQGKLEEQSNALPDEQDSGATSVEHITEENVAESEEHKSAETVTASEEHKYEETIPLSVSENLPKLSETKITLGIESMCKQLKNSDCLPFFAKNEQLVEGSGRFYIVFTDEEIDKDSPKKCTPLMVMDAGMGGSITWTKFDQMLRYVYLICAHEQTSFTFNRPMLLSFIKFQHVEKDFTSGSVGDAVSHDDGGDKDEGGGCGCATSGGDMLQGGGNAGSHDDIMGGDASGGDCPSICVTIGAFLCFDPPKDIKNDKVAEREQDPKCRIIPLQHIVSNNLVDASKNFGKLLEVTTYFQKWVNEKPNLAKDFQYEYFSSNCCRMGDRVSKHVAISFLFLVSYFFSLNLLS